jgi:hypothetical protein
MSVLTWPPIERLIGRHRTSKVWSLNRNGLNAAYLTDVAINDPHQRISGFRVAPVIGDPASRKPACIRPREGGTGRKGPSAIGPQQRAGRSGLSPTSAALPRRASAPRGSTRAAGANPSLGSSPLMRRCRLRGSFRSANPERRRNWLMQDAKEQKTDISGSGTARRLSAGSSRGLRHTRDTSGPERSPSIAQYLDHQSHAVVDRIRKSMPDASTPDLVERNVWGPSNFRPLQFRDDLLRLCGFGPLPEKTRPCSGPGSSEMRCRSFGGSSPATTGPQCAKWARVSCFPLTNVPVSLLILLHLRGLILHGVLPPLQPNGRPHAHPSPKDGELSERAGQTAVGNLSTASVRERPTPKGYSLGSGPPYMTP